MNPKHLPIYFGYWQDQVVDTCEHGNEAAGSISGEYFLDLSSISQFLDQLNIFKFLICWVPVSFFTSLSVY